MKSAPDLSRLEALEAAEKALAEVLRFHETARERGVRKGDEAAPSAPDTGDEPPFDEAAYEDRGSDDLDEL